MRRCGMGWRMTGGRGKEGSVRGVRQGKVWTMVFDPVVGDEQGGLGREPIRRYRHALADREPRFGR